MTISESREIRMQIILRQIGAKIAYYRALRCMRQDELAQKIHSDKSVISRIERGKYHSSISVNILIGIADALQIEPALLLTFTELEKRLWWEDLSLHDDLVDDDSEDS